MTHAKLLTIVDRRAEHLLKCSGCDWVQCGKKRTEAPPKGLWLERFNHGPSIVVVGLNPGNPIAIEDWKNPQYSYQQWKIDVKTKNPSYFNKTRKLVASLGYGRILWTDAVKGTIIKNPPIREISPKTVARCVNLHLLKELALVPRWPIIALGNTAFNYIGMFVRDRTVIGIPHPSRHASNHWNKIAFTKSGKAKNNFEICLAGPKGGAEK
jgi:hypothetical protein